ncbi:hypothetical protein SLEP1_g56286 [Rubroshorea leprosula]|uniref:Uncharacterized protein n=1 Tax=Rubroshorea leprosula TaxID=152421 RepID=A0AAV5MJ73_9ROSI|nr:hypothetical protein SLEP1_g56286 [Rubroshorea leprosula]
MVAEIKRLTLSEGADKVLCCGSQGASQSIKATNCQLMRFQPGS